MRNPQIEEYIRTGFLKDVELKFQIKPEMFSDDS